MHYSSHLFEESGKLADKGIFLRAKEFDAWIIIGVFFDDDILTMYEKSIT